MDLQDLKQKWNVLDERLSTSEVYNKRMLREMLQGKNQTHYDKLQRQGKFNFLYTLFAAAVIVPILHMQGIFHETSFYILEAVCLLGALMVGCRLLLLSRLNVMDGLQSQLRALVNYKRGYVYETVIGIPLAVFGICLTLCVENATSPTGLFFVALGVMAGGVCAWQGWQKHKQTMQEIEKSLAELKEFE